MKRTVILPEEIETRLEKLTKLDEETVGALLYRNQGGNCTIEYSFILGVGTPEEVRARRDRWEILNEFLRVNPDYKYVIFHTHTEESTSRYPSAARYFSQV